MEDLQQNPEPAGEPPIRAPVSKSATVTKLLSRNRGATLAEMMAATNW